jgi:hypothetical protein
MTVRALLPSEAANAGRDAKAARMTKKVNLFINMILLDSKLPKG